MNVAAQAAAGPAAPFVPRLRAPGVEAGAGEREPPFVELPDHAAALAAVRSLAKRPADASGPAALLWGPSGCGKSRLVREFLHLNADARGMTAAGSLVHLTAAGLAAALDEALAGGFAGPLRDSLLAADTLVVEDLAAVRARPKTQDLLLAAADAVLDAGGQVLWTANTLPGELPAVSRRLTDRLRGGVVAGVPVPAEESRAAFLAAVAEDRRVAAPADVVAALAAGLPVGPRGLLAAAGRMSEMALAAGSPGWTAALAAALLDADRTGTAEDRPTLAAVSRAVAARFGLPVARVRTAGRSAAVVPARQCGMALARELTGESLRAVAEHFGRSDHGTVLHAVRRFGQRVAADPTFAADAEAVRAAVTRPRRGAGEWGGPATGASAAR